MGIPRKARRTVHVQVYHVCGWNGTRLDRYISTSVERFEKGM